jgi:pterin-4a-carbinolamine dehydratase
MNHHPDCKIHKAFQLEISLLTHDKNEITDLDYQLAQKIDFRNRNSKILNLQSKCQT